MSDMSVRRLAEGRKPQAQTTSSARRKQRVAALEALRVHRVPGAAMQAALELAEGDPRRVKVQRDGTVIVRNR